MGSGNALASLQLLDGNEVELAADRPRDVWPDLRDPGWDGGPMPLDLSGLLDVVAAEPQQAAAGPGLTVGHLTCTSATSIAASSSTATCSGSRS